MSCGIQKHLKWDISFVPIIRPLTDNGIEYMGIEMQTLDDKNVWHVPNSMFWNDIETITDRDIVFASVSQSGKVALVDKQIFIENSAEYLAKKYYDDLSQSQDTLVFFVIIAVAIVLMIVYAMHR